MYIAYIYTHTHTHTHTLKHSLADGLSCGICITVFLHSQCMFINKLRKSTKVKLVWQFTSNIRRENG
jgi:hypothetical protein